MNHTVRTHGPSLSMSLMIMEVSLIFIALYICISHVLSHQLGFYSCVSMESRYLFQNSW